MLHLTVGLQKIIV